MIWVCHMVGFLVCDGHSKSDSCVYHSSTEETEWFLDLTVSLAEITWFRFSEENCVKTKVEVNGERRVGKSLWDPHGHVGLYSFIHILIHMYALVHMCHMCAYVHLCNNTHTYLYSHEIWCLFPFHVMLPWNIVLVISHIYNDKCQ